MQARGAGPGRRPTAAVAKRAGHAVRAGGARLVPNARLVLVGVQRAGEAVALPVRHAAEPIKPRRTRRLHSQRRPNRRLWRRLARAAEAVAGRPVAWPLPLGVQSCTEPPAAPRGGAGGELRHYQGGHFGHVAKGGNNTLTVLRRVGNARSVPRGLRLACNGNVTTM